MTRGSLSTAVLVMLLVCALMCHAAPVPDDKGDGDKFFGDQSKSVVMTRIRKTVTVHSVPEQVKLFKSYQTNTSLTYPPLPMGSYEGTWRTLSQGPKFPQTGDHGKVNVQLAYQPDTVVWTSLFLFMDGDFLTENDLVVREQGRQSRVGIVDMHDLSVIRAGFAPGNENMTLTFANIIRPGQEPDEMEQEECPVLATLHFMPTNGEVVNVEGEEMFKVKSNDPNNPDEFVPFEMTGIVFTPCGDAIEFELTQLPPDVATNRTLAVVTMLTMMSIAQIWLTLKQMEYSSVDQRSLSRVCLVMIGQQAVIDSYIFSILFLLMAFSITNEVLFNAYANAALFKFVLFTVFQCQYSILVWRARQPAMEAQELSTKYLRFIALIMMGNLFCLMWLSSQQGQSAIRSRFLCYHLPRLFIGLYTFWIPQIVSNVLRNTRRALHWSYLLGMSATRLALPLYMFGCPNNVFNLQVDHPFCVFLMSSVGAQLVVLHLQDMWGSRFFVPQQFLPTVYDYFRPPPTTHSQSDCVICMSSIELTNSGGGDVMTTPCDHVFHAPCLKRWIRIKLECPTCRGVLPRPDYDDDDDDDLHRPGDHQV